MWWRIQKLKNIVTKSRNDSDVSAAIYSKGRQHHRLKLADCPTAYVAKAFIATIFSLGLAVS